MGYSKGAAGSHLVLQQFISDHGIPQMLITDGDQAETLVRNGLSCVQNILSNSIAPRLINRIRTLLNDGYRRLRPQSSSKTTHRV